METIVLIVLFTSAAGCLSAAGVILIRRWPEIRLLDPSSIKEEQERLRREAVLRRRFDRLQDQKTAPVKKGIRRVVYAGKTVFHRGYLKLVRLNQFYEQTQRSGLPNAEARKKKLLEEARSLARDLKWSEAEKRYLEVLLMDERNIEAYKGVAGVHLRQGKLDQAKETLEFLEKINPGDDAVYAGLAEIAERNQDRFREERWRLKAVEARPRLANRHAELARFYQKRGSWEAAWSAAEQAIALEKKSPRFQELAFECALGAKKIPEAEQCYARLRVLVRDTDRLQRYRRKLEEGRRG